MPTMKSGDILGHEFMGEMIEMGSVHNKFRKGDRIVVPFNINCGECRQCKLGNYSVCQRSNRNAAMAAEQFGYTTAGLFGYSHLTGGYAGGQAEFVRVPMADVAPMKVPDGMTDEEVLFLTDIFPTGYQAAEQAGIKGGEIVAIWGSGPVGLFAIQSAKVLGAERIIAIETVPERIAMARKAGATDIVNFAEEDVFERIKEISKGEGADVVIDCVGMEASPGHGQGGLVSAVKEKVMPGPSAPMFSTRPSRPCGRAAWFQCPASTEASRNDSSRTEGSLPPSTASMATCASSGKDSPNFRASSGLEAFPVERALIDALVDRNGAKEAEGDEKGPIGDILEPHPPAIGGDIFGFGRDAARPAVDAAKSAIPAGRQPPQHALVGEVGERMAERRQLPIEDSKQTRRL